MDALSEVLRSLRLQGSVYCAWEFRAPWGMSLVPARTCPFHVVQSGTCMLIRKDGQQVALEPGDVVALFDGAGHRICDSPTSRAEPLERILGRQPKGVPVHRYGGSGAVSRVICGKFGLDDHESIPTTLRHLPPVVHIRHQDSVRVRAFTATMEQLAEEMRGGESGSERAASLLTEMLLIQIVRIVLAEKAEPTSAGWLAGLRDPHIGLALAAIHSEPGRPWSVESLATKVGLSRSVFAERFADKVGRTPMSYLGQWRLQRAQRLLRESELTISEISHRLGYASAASFDRAFKRAHQLSPSAYRERSAARTELHAVAAGSRP